MTTWIKKVQLILTQSESDSFPCNVVKYIKYGNLPLAKASSNIRRLSLSMIIRRELASARTPNVAKWDANVIPTVKPRK